MEDNIVKLNQDLQECIADNNDNFSYSYGVLYYDQNKKHLKQSLAFFENLKIIPYKDRMKLEGTLASGDFCFTDEDILSIQKQVWKRRMEKYENKTNKIKQKNSKMILANLDLENLIFNREEKLNIYRNVNSKDLELLSLIKKGLGSVNLDFNIEKHKEMLILSLNCDKILLTKEQIRTLIILSDKLDFLLISPQYTDDEYDQNCNGIRIAMGINLIK